MNYYTIFGLNVASEVICPELHTINALDQPEVSIKYGSLAHIPFPEPNRSKNHLINNHQLLINISGVAKYLVTKGEQVIVDPDHKASDQEVRLFLLGSTMGAILHQRGYLAIHGNGIVINGECIIFAGHSGKGKSTLAAAFAQKGFQLLCDDLCAIKITDKGEAFVQPGFPHIKLWPESLKQLKEQPTNLTRVRPDEDKYIVPMDTKYCEQAVPLKKIYTLHFHDKDSIDFQKLNALDTLLALNNYTYKQRMLKTINPTKEHYALYMKLAKTTLVSRVFRPKNITILNTLIDAILLESHL